MLSFTCTKFANKVIWVAKKKDWILSLSYKLQRSRMLLHKLDICDPSQQNWAVVCYKEKCDISFIWKSILLTQRWYHSCVNWMQHCNFMVKNKSLFLFIFFVFSHTNGVISWNAFYQQLHCFDVMGHICSFSEKHYFSRSPLRAVKCVLPLPLPLISWTNLQMATFCAMQHYGLNGTLTNLLPTVLVPVRSVQCRVYRA